MKQKYFPFPLWFWHQSTSIVSPVHARIESIGHPRHLRWSCVRLPEIYRKLRLQAQGLSRPPFCFPACCDSTRIPMSIKLTNHFNHQCLIRCSYHKKYVRDILNHFEVLLCIFEIAHGNNQRLVLWKYRLTSNELLSIPTFLLSTQVWRARRQQTLWASALEVFRTSKYYRPVAST